MLSEPPLAQLYAVSLSPVTGYESAEICTCPFVMFNILMRGCNGDSPQSSLEFFSRIFENISAKIRIYVFMACSDVGMILYSGPRSHACSHYTGSQHSFCVCAGCILV